MPMSEVLESKDLNTTILNALSILDRDAQPYTNNLLSVASYNEPSA